MKLTKAFKGVPNGAIYPVIYKVGDDCPEELEEAAKLLGVFDAATKKTTAKKDSAAKVEVAETTEAKPAEQAE